MGGRERGREERREGRMVFLLAFLEDFISLAPFFDTFSLVEAISMIIG